ncbi:MAG: succinic semialdehyde dehydrogenase, partial [Nocardioides sp.]
MSAADATPGPLVDGPADPEHDPTATYGLAPAAVNRLTRLVVATSGQSAEVFSPLAGQPLGQVPQSTVADV